MVDYLYKARIWKDTTNVVEVNPTTELANKTEFETNYKSSTISINNLELMGTTFVILKTYTDFKVLIDGINILWTDVKCENGGNFYDLYLLTTSTI
jgi:hypothetical protein